MWLKMHPWIFPAIIGSIGLLYLIIQLPLIFGTKKDGHSHSGVPFIGSIHFLIVLHAFFPQLHRKAWLWKKCRQRHSVVLQ